MNLLAILLALAFDIAAPRAWTSKASLSADRLYREGEVDFDKLGFPRLNELNWLVPVAVAALGASLLHGWFDAFSPVVGFVFSLGLLVLCIRFSSLQERLTSLGLFLNQGDLHRTRDILRRWALPLHQHAVPVKNEHDAVVLSIELAVERLLRQFFVPVFCFVVWPSPFLLVLYAGLWWTVLKDRERQQLHGEAAMATLHEDWANSPLQTLLTARFWLYLIEWLPTRLLALSLCRNVKWDDGLESWRMAGDHSPMSNRARLLSLVTLACRRQESEDFKAQQLVELRRLVLEALAIWLMFIAAWDLLI